MLRVRTVASLTISEQHRVRAFLDAVHRSTGARLNDHLRVDLEQGPRPGFLCVLGEGPDGELRGYAQASVGNDGYVVDALCGPDGADHADDLERLLSALLSSLPIDDPITWWAHTDAVSVRIASALAMVPHRQLLLMCRPLPLEPEHAAAATGVSLRPFIVGRDETAWLEVNNAAFQLHGEQGGWDLPRLEQRERDDWFDADGFLLHERDGRLAAFCWTKLHRGLDWDRHLPCGDDDTVGEIYVIAVHPEFHGLGLGRALTVAGLLHMQRVGASTAMLYVDSANTSAVGLYRALGFGVADTQQSFLRPALISPQEPAR